MQYKQYWVDYDEKWETSKAVEMENICHKNTVKEYAQHKSSHKSDKENNSVSDTTLRTKN